MGPEKIKVVLAEDEFVIAEDISMKLGDSGYEVLAAFDKAEAALPFILREKPDIILADIYLAGEMDGIELVKQIQRKIQIPVVYITANSDVATYELAKATRPNAFLIKPFTSANLLTTVDLALFNFSEGRISEQIGKQAAADAGLPEFLIRQSLFVRINNRYKKIACADILFIEAFGSYAHIQTTDQRYTLSQNLAQFQRKTPLPNLIRIHRSFIVNIDVVDSFDESYVFIQNHKLPLSDGFRAGFLDRIHTL